VINYIRATFGNPANQDASGARSAAPSPSPRP
jgi:hypothetical protein